MHIYRNNMSIGCRFQELSMCTLQILNLGKHTYRRRTILTHIHTRRIFQSSELVPWYIALNLQTTFQQLIIPCAQMTHFFLIHSHVWCRPNLLHIQMHLQSVYSYEQNTNQPTIQPTNIFISHDNLYNFWFFNGKIYRTVIGIFCWINMNICLICVYWMHLRHNIFVSLFF